MDALVPILIVFILGAAVGSFLNVVIYRLPAGLSLVYPPSRCPRCETRLKPYDNVPVLGWLWLKGRCRSCKLPIASRYP
ncbi:MAG: prepilin peptidase, partial [Phormidesmis sp.]